MSQECVPFAEIVAELKRICAERKTGTLYITSQTNRSAQLAIDKGSIVYLYYFNKRGQDALHVMSEIRSGRYRFQEGMVPVMRSELLLTEDILRYLSAAAENMDVGERGQAEPDAAERSGSGPAPAASLTAEQRRILEEGLAVYIGPMAAIICEDHLGSAVGVKVAVELLAAEIPAAAQAQRFREEMLQRLVQ